MRSSLAENGGESYPHEKSIFLPTLCKISIKDVKISHSKNPSSSLLNDPLSPKITCIGQVKRNNKIIAYPTTTAVKTTANHQNPKITCIGQVKRNNKIIAYPTTTAVKTTANYHNTTKHNQLMKNFFPGKILMPVTTSGGTRRFKIKVDHKKVNISELDPPLPVVKRVQPPGGSRDCVNIWKRRFDGVALKNLQIENFHLHEKNFLPSTTV